MSNRNRARILGLAGAALAASAAPAAETVAPLSLGFPIEELRGPSSYFARSLATSPLLQDKQPEGRELAAGWGAGGGIAFYVENGELRQARFASTGVDGPPLREAPGDAIPGSRMQTAGPLTVFLSAPRTDYRHAVLGDGIEAGQITISERQPLSGVVFEPRPVPTRVTTLSSGPEAVFEDLEPRLADLDGDGRPEILVVKSYFEKGAALAVIAKTGDGWSIAAETPPLGQPHRWLNVAAIADFDGDGKTDVALVRSPHLEGVLQVWSWDNGRLTLKHEAAGYSNHALGSTALDNAAAVDVNGDGRPELVVPTLDRRALAVVSLAGGIREISRIPLPGPVGKGLAVLGSGKDWHALAGLEDGRLVAVKPR